MYLSSVLNYFLTSSLINLILSLAKEQSRMLFKGECHQSEVVIVYLQKARDGENIACKDYVSWQV